ncbi:MAG TPA: hypothetical protein VG722_03495 [Tepidisphaeraceae bacterium]|nr:hypothetical protein [Tepidisphaeraceae bacterium]
MQVLSSITIFTQRFDAADIPIVGLLILLEAVLSLDNALVLGILARRLPPDQRSRGLFYGLIGALFFRIVAVALAAYLLRWRIMKLAGGLYLLWIMAKHFLFEGKDANNSSACESAQSDAPPRKFWTTVALIEFTDIFFAIDSILAAIALVGPPPTGYPPAKLHPKLWLIVVGGFLGVILMRFAAVAVIYLLEQFPRLGTSAYLLVGLIGAKLLADWFLNLLGKAPRLNFHSPNEPAFWVFWSLMALCVLIGFIPRRNAARPLRSPQPLSTRIES